MKSQDIEHLKNTIQLARDINDTDRSKLLELLNTFSGYGLVWVDKQEDNENKILNGQMPVLNENLDRYIKARPTPPQIVEEKNANQTTLSFETVEDVKSEDNATEQAAPHHLLIEGDNLPALTALTYTHEGLVDVIYIDPPYNTGNKDFKYNDRFVDKEDPYRHSKWLSFMHKRLLIAKKLLKNTGVIFISIDDNEQANLKLLCDEVFGEQNFRNNVIVRRGIKNVQAQFEELTSLSVGHEYIFVYTKLITTRLSKLEKSLGGKFDGKWDTFWRGTDRPTMRYDLFGKLPETGQWRWEQQRAIKAINNYNEFQNNFVSEMSLDDYHSYQSTATNEKIDFLRLNSDNVVQYYVPSKETKLMSDNWMDISLSGSFAKFQTEKNVELIERIINWQTDNETPSTILDFFAGSGTTLHAVMQLNSEDGGKRQCILVTNNENGIAEEVCYERNKRVINGYTKPNGTAVPGLTNNHLHYYQLDWFDELAAPLSQDKPNEHSSIRLARLMREMLMIKENCFEDIEAKILRGYHPDLKFKDDNHPDLDVLESADKYVVIVYTDDAIADGVRIIEQLPDAAKPVVVYPFEYQGEPDPMPFETVKERVTLKALPSSYKETYDHILQDLRKRRRRFVISDEDTVEADLSAEHVEYQ
jgi:adenine-specific DNA-methyltransferase